MKEDILENSGITSTDAPVKTRILFVDDEPYVLSGMKRAFWDMSSEWSLSFAESARAALSFLEKNDCDIIVTDMMMPEMNGCELLRIVRERYPHMFRIILSGHFNKELAMAGLMNSHQFLSKPCSLDNLKSKLLKFSELYKILQNHAMKILLTQISELPALPDTVAALTTELMKTEPSVTVLTDIISGDTGMAATILHIGNSSFFGQNNNLTDIKKAILIMGFDTVMSLAISAKIFSSVYSSRCQLFHILDFCDHSLRTAVASRKISEYSGMAAETTKFVFLSGLLHDIGKLLFAEYLPDPFAKSLHLSAEQKIPSVEAERRFLGVPHTEVGAYLLRLWGFSEEVIESAAYHHGLPKSTDCEHEASAIVCFANAFVNSSCNLNPQSLAELNIPDEKIRLWNSFSSKLKN